MQDNIFASQKCLVDTRMLSNNLTYIQGSHDGHYVIINTHVTPIFNA